MAQSDDLAWFETNRGYISAQYPNKFVLIKDKAVVGAYPDYQSAFQAGTSMFNTSVLTIKQATPVERTEHVAAIGMGRRRLWLGQQQQQQFQDIADQLRQNGAVVQVVIAAPSSYQQQAAGQGKPAGGSPQTVQGMIDTGASISTVSDQVAAAAGLVQTGSVPLGGVGGTSERPIYAASFSIPQFGVTVDPIQVGGVTIPMPGIDILVGRDILKTLYLAYHGAQGNFALTSDAQQQAAAPGTPGAPAPAAPGAGPSTGTILLIGGGIVAATVGALFAFKVI